ncbi:Cyanoglobin, Hemoglobin-like protein HbN [Methylophaga frappieri]|uniref:Group 1 truncated hemoglobin n=1 Tax=Methylophaga frappieri (strain ATCC BAA-2434 / DSM 25690 / JAM7) TaxID=754477 RepID=I1YH18_METFJ|nr:group 1 truncated hemoglobin [Methylophaga frappieri]AFJ02211.1 Cyanoglobin, Hemoglobin-like protein HbN [Methylophaga frappieri]
MRSAIVTLLILALSGCASQPKQRTLYDDLGGAEGIDQIVSHFINQIGHDPVILPYFADSHVSRFREKITEHFCHISDGPCAYTGDNMVDIHVGMDINEHDFNRVVDLLYNALEQSGVPHPAQNRLIARLAPLRSDIIYR